ncbi:MAG TPA: hypothetical protein VIY72_04455 [Acidimicrobiales bacterium]
MEGRAADGGLGPVTDLIAARTARRVAGRVATNPNGNGDIGASTLVGIGGGVAVGKSHLAAALAARLSNDHDLASVVVASDGFLLPNHELARRGLAARKGYPESYDLEAIDAFLLDVRAGRDVLEVPVYDHLLYDVLDERRRADRATVVIFEGVNVLHFADRLDVGIYLDAAEADMRRWFVERVLRLRTEAASVPDAYLAPVAHLDDAVVSEFAVGVWDAVNAPNLADHIEPTRTAAEVVVRKGADHSIVDVVVEVR